MNTPIGRCSKSPIQGRPAGETDELAAAIYEVYAFPAQERQPELDGLKKRGPNTQVGAPGKQGLLLKDAEL
jgi:hypothetical protein